MSKYDQYIKDYLLKAKEVSLEKIGVFTLNRSLGEEKVIQAQFIDFQFNKKAETSDGLIDFIVTETGKNKTLISSDLASLFEGARQYINIGKAFSVAGLGMLSLNRSGEYEFQAVQTNVPVSESVPNNAVKKNAEKQGNDQAGRNVVIFFAMLIVALIVTGLGWGIYKYLNKQKTDQVLTEAPGNIVDSANAQQVKPKDTTNANTPLSALAGDSAYYKFIFETTFNKYRAHNRYDSLKSWGEHVFVDSTTTDSSTVYNLFVKAKILAKDTAHVKDSVQKYFQRPIKIVSQ